MKLPQKYLNKTIYVEVQMRSWTARYKIQISRIDDDGFEGKFKIYNEGEWNKHISMGRWSHYNLISHRISRTPL